MSNRAIAKKLQSIYGGNESAIVALDRLVANSSSLSRAKEICNAGINPKIQEMLAQTFLNCYCAGFCAGVGYQTDPTNPAPAAAGNDGNRTESGMKQENR